MSHRDKRGHSSMRLPFAFTLLAICFTASGQTSPEISKWIYTDSSYTNAAGKRIFIQNSFPKGGGRYTQANGKTFSYVIFWYRVVNESETPIELTVNFPSDSFTIFQSHNSYTKIFLLKEPMTLEKVPMLDYGVTELKSFLDAGFYNPSSLHRTIKPKEACLFYISMLFMDARGSARMELVLNGQDLFYNMNVGSDKALIPCGKVVFK